MSMFTCILMCLSPIIGSLPLRVNLREYCACENTLDIILKYSDNILLTQTLVFFGGCQGWCNSTYQFLLEY